MRPEKQCNKSNLHFLHKVGTSSFQTSCIQAFYRKMRRRWLPFHHAWFRWGYSVNIDRGNPYNESISVVFFSPNSMPVYAK